MIRPSFPAIIAAPRYEYRPDARSAPPDDGRRSALLSDEPTIELVVRAQDRRPAGGRSAPAAQRAAAEALGAWPAAGRGAGQPRYRRSGAGNRAARAAPARHLPAPTRRRDAGVPPAVGPQSHPRRSATDRAPPAPCELPDDMASEEPSPLETGGRGRSRIERTTRRSATLSPRDRQLVVHGSKRNGVTTRSPGTSACQRRMPRAWRSRARCVVCWTRLKET